MADSVIEDKGKKEDNLRTKELTRYGVKIIRFSDLDILNNIEGVYEVIEGVIKSKKNTPPHPPLARGQA